MLSFKGCETGINTIITGIKSRVKKCVGLKEAVQSHLGMRSLESATKYVKNVNLVPVAFIAFAAQLGALYLNEVQRWHMALALLHCLQVLLLTGLSYNHGIISLGQNKTRLMHVKSSTLRLKYRLFYSPSLSPTCQLLAARNTSSSQMY